LYSSEITASVDFLPPQQKTFAILQSTGGMAERMVRKTLEREVELGAWTIFKGDAAMVFDADPESLWYRLTRKSEQRIASIICRAGFQPAADFQSASCDVPYAPERPIENRPQVENLHYKK